MTLKAGRRRQLRERPSTPKRNRSYAMTLTVKPDDFQTRGCIIGVLCKTVNWTPAN